MATLWSLPTVAAAATFSNRLLQDNPYMVRYEGTEGPGVGKHIVLIAGDHEYRSEEILPALGRILAKNLGFKQTAAESQFPPALIRPKRLHRIDS